MATAAQKSRSAASSVFSVAAGLLQPQGYKPRLEKYWYDPILFIHDFFIGFKPTPYQKDCIKHLLTEQKICIRAGHTAGKTSMVAAVVLWFVMTREDMCRAQGGDWKVVTTASVERQLTKYLWPEIKKWCRKSTFDWDALGREPFDRRTELLGTMLKQDHGEAFAVSSDDPANIEGAHADHLLYIVDEAKTVRADTFDAVEGALMGTGESYAFVISTPGEPVGRFYEIQSKKQEYDDWWVRHITVNEAVKAGRVTWDQVQRRKRQWGEHSAIYKNRIEGEFATDVSDSLIPLAWVEAAMGRGASIEEENVQAKLWINRHTVPLQPLDRPAAYAGLANCISCDVARSGEDMTVIAVRIGFLTAPLIAFHSDDTMVVTGQVVKAILQFGQREATYAVVDVIGIGAGVVDRLREQGYTVEAYNGSSASPFTDSSGELEFANRRAASWWGMRELLNPANEFSKQVSLPDDDELLSDLCAPRYKTTSSGKIIVESKDDIRKRIGRSPDRGDAVVMAYSDRIREEQYGGIVEYYEPVTISAY